MKRFFTLLLAASCLTAVGQKLPVGKSIEADFSKGEDVAWVDFCNESMDLSKSKRAEFWAEYETMESDLSAEKRKKRSHEMSLLNPFMTSEKAVTQAIEDKGLDFFECFEHFDENGDGMLEEHELQGGMEKLGVDLTRSETRALMDRFPSASRRGVIMYRDFVKALKIPRREEDTSSVERLLRDELQRLSETRSGRPNFGRLFDEIDRTGGG